MIKLINGDCLEVLKTLEDKSIDLILQDPPYNTTACKWEWDIMTKIDEFWAEWKRIIKDNGVIVMTASQPFTSKLVMSNLKMFKYEWVWDKVTARGHLVAKKRPMAQHENVLVFYKNAPTYNPQMVKMDKPQKGKSVEASRTSIMGTTTTKESKSIIRTHKYPKTIVTIGMDKRVGHPTQKPVALMEYLINTYTNEGGTVFDGFMGSGTTGVACKNLDRNFIGIELDPEYYKIAEARINLSTTKPIVEKE